MMVTFRRAALASALWGGVLVLMIIAGMGPNPVLLALVVGALAVGGWLFSDIGARVQSANWRTADVTSGSDRGADNRVELIHRYIDGFTRGSGDVLSPVLVSLINARVSSRHGVDRATDAATFRRVIGPELDAFIANQPGRRAMTPHDLSDIITKIERL